MPDINGFLKFKRKESGYRPIPERIKDYKEAALLRGKDSSLEQSSRCMDCGTPFCHWGCPLGNYVPEWNNLMADGHWEEAYRLLEAGNNFPEFTGRLCPALCEYACVLGVNDDPVTIRENELSIIEYAFSHNFVKPCLPQIHTGKKIAIIGSGPAGLACADRLNKSGHKVVVFEKDKKIGGILRYGIPDFKLEKWIIERRLDILRKEGINFKTGVNVGEDYSESKLLKEFDSVCLVGGSKVPRDLNIKGRDLKGIHFAMEYLVQSNRRISGEPAGNDEIIDAYNKKVVIIGGGDTGSDCVGTARRQGADSIIQIEVLPKPPEYRTDSMAWPFYPTLLKTSSSHQEGCNRKWSVLTKEFIGESGSLKKLKCVKVEFSKSEKPGRLEMKEVSGSEFEIEADLAVLAVGFIHPQHNGLLDNLKIELDKRGNVKTDSNYMTSKNAVFSAGDMHQGQSLVVRAINEGRQAADAIDRYLKG